MTDWVICGSCYVYVEDTGDADCPRCGDPLNPSLFFLLDRFAEYGINPTYKGVPLPQSQRAAKAVLLRLEEAEELLRAAFDPDEWDGLQERIAGFLKKRPEGSE